PTNGLQMLQVDLPADDALTPGQTGGDLTPGVDQTAVTEGLATVGMGTALIGGKHIALGLYRPGTQQYLPVGGAGHRGKRRRNHDQLGPGVTQRLIQLGKAYIVTDAQPQPAHRGIDADDPVAIAVIPGFAVTALVVGHLDVEQVQLVIAGDLPALVVDDQTAGRGPGAGCGGQRDAAGNQPAAVATRLLGEKRPDRSAAVVLRGGDGLQRAVAEGSETLWQQDQLSALLRGFANQPGGDIKVRLHIGSADHLYGGYAGHFNPPGRVCRQTRGRIPRWVASSCH